MSTTVVPEQQLAHVEQKLHEPEQPQHEPEQPQSPQHEHEQQCHICMGAMKDAAAVKGCGHQFCHACLEQWVRSRQQPCCPVCRAEIKFLVLADGTEQAAEPATAAPPAEAEPDLSCLDHSYFLAEVARLLSRAQSVHNRVYREAYGCSRKGACRQTGVLLDGVQEVVDTLTDYRHTLEGEVRFDPQVLLQELYRLERQLTSLQAGSSTDAEEPDNTSAAADPWQSGAFDQLQIHDEDDHDHDFEHDYEYCSDEDDNWRPKTSGRRPTQRHGVKQHVRSNSGGSQQPRQQGQRQPSPLQQPRQGAGR